MKEESYTVGHYLVERLKELGLDDIFGVPGDFVLGMFHILEKSSIRTICTCNELNAAYAADGYARRKGIGALLTTYVVGELSAINGVAGAFAERVPVVQITGCPATGHYKSKTLLHHTLGDYFIPFKIYKEVTVASTLLLDAATAPSEIDRVLKACLYHKLPVYIGIPTDVVVAPCKKPTHPLEVEKRPSSDRRVLEAALQDILHMIGQAKMPVIVVDGEIARFELQKEVLSFIESSGLPFASMMLGKSVIDETHPQFIGLYEGDRSRDYVRKRVEESDCIILLGVMLTDFNTGGFTAVIDASKTIKANIEQLYVRHHKYEHVCFRELLRELSSQIEKRDSSKLNLKKAVEGCPHRATMAYEPKKGEKLTLSRFFDRLSHFLDENTIMMVETGSALFAGAEVLQPKGCVFMSQTFFGSIGYTVGATLGASIADPKKRVCLVVGEGSLQVTVQDISTMIRYKTHPTIFVINNDGYLVERVISDGPFNDLQPWQYQKLPEVFSGGWGCRVETEDELEKALAQAKEHSDEVVVIEMIIGKWDSPPSMTKAGAAMAKSNFLDTFST